MERTSTDARHGSQGRSGHRGRTAVVGSGVAGLTAAHILGRSRHVTLYEADDRLGGHAHTHELVSPHDGRMHRLDSGFIVHNRRTYPRLLRLFDELGVATQVSEMSISVRCEGCGLEYAGARGPAALFARPGNLLRGPYLRLLAEVPVFHRASRRLLDAGGDEALTLGRFLEREGFSPYFRSHFVTPLVSAVWSCDAGTVLRYPAAYLFRFMAHHGMLSVSGSPTWRTVSGGSREYVDRIARQIAEVRTGTPVRAVRRHADGADVTAEDGTTESYDAVVIAVHPDQALRLLADASALEREVLGAFRYSRNTTLLHTDTRLLPRAWSPVPRPRSSAAPLEGVPDVPDAAALGPPAQRPPEAAERGHEQEGAEPAEAAGEREGHARDHPRERCAHLSSPFTDRPAATPRGPRPWSRTPPPRAAGRR
ncbi:FAD-dependent oxidoreductase [Streptomyces sp. NPDC002766]|uniref:NAD(P)/FAD-dependent oxidoreductase n=1 Tax=Streptomyces sp. NPDC002766 TaxID=3154429 RepID=UPI0033175438